MSDSPLSLKKICD